MRAANMVALRRAGSARRQRVRRWLNAPKREMIVFMKQGNIGGWSVQLFVRPGARGWLLLHPRRQWRAKSWPDKNQC